MTERDPQIPDIEDVNFFKVSFPFCDEGEFLTYLDIDPEKLKVRGSFPHICVIVDFNKFKIFAAKGATVSHDTLAQRSNLRIDADQKVGALSLVRESSGSLNLKNQRGYAASTEQKEQILDVIKKASGIK